MSLLLLPLIKNDELLFYDIYSFIHSKQNEIRDVMKYGVTGERIIFAHPAKLPSHIKYAQKMNVEKMTADTEMELLKISEIFPEAK